MTGLNLTKLAVLTGLAVGIAAPVVDGTYARSVNRFEHRKQEESARYVAANERFEGLQAYEKASGAGTWRALPTLAPIGFRSGLFGIIAALLVLASRPFWRWLKT